MAKDSIVLCFQDTINGYFIVYIFSEGTNNTQQFEHGCDLTISLFCLFYLLSMIISKVFKYVFNDTDNQGTLILNTEILTSQQSTLQSQLQAHPR